MDLFLSSAGRRDLARPQTERVEGATLGLGDPAGGAAPLAQASAATRRRRDGEILRKRAFMDFPLGEVRPGERAGAPAECAGPSAPRSISVTARSISVGPGARSRLVNIHRRQRVPVVHRVPADGIDAPVRPADRYSFADRTRRDRRRSRSRRRARPRRRCDRSVPPAPRRGGAPSASARAPSRHWSGDRRPRRC